jgi:Ubiquitin family.
MRVIFKINKDKFPFEIASTDLISSIKQQISSKIDIPPSNFHLISGIENNSILLTDSFQLSFFQLSENSIIEISPYGTQNLSSKKFKRA